MFIVDNLDTHKSADLVRWVAERCDVNEDLGKLFTRGHLRNRASRTAFLSQKDHTIRFAYTPKHCSWLNEIERWFSKLARAVLRRGSFNSQVETTAAEMLRKMQIGTSELLN